VGYVSSTDGGAHWTSTTNIMGPMTLSWLPNTTQGRMVGDYMSTSFSGGKAFPVFAVAAAPTGGSDCSTAGVTCHEAMNTVVTGLASRGHNPAGGDRVVASSGHMDTTFHVCPPSTVFSKHEGIDGAELIAHPTVLETKSRREISLKLSLGE